jgi:hypothetical protein
MIPNANGAISVLLTKIAPPTPNRTYHPVVKFMLGNPGIALFTCVAPGAVVAGWLMAGVVMQHPILVG